MSEHAETLSDQEQQRRRALVTEHMPRTPFIALLGLLTYRIVP